jgi:DNA-binding CsgD family transcriptional regulator/PAS domain-containing protein
VTHALDRLLNALYAAPARPEMWEAFLKEFGTVSGVNKAALIAHDISKNDHRILAALGDGIKDRDRIRRYEDLYCKFDEWTVRFSKRPAAGTILQGEELWPGHEFLKSTFYNEFLKEVGVCGMACIGVSALLRAFECLSIYRGPSEGEFDQEHIAALQFVTPHLQTALYTRRKLLELESRVSDMETALDHLHTALVLVDATAKVLFANRNARAIVDRRDGLAFCRGELVAQEVSARATLRSILAAAISRGTVKGKQSAMLVSRATKRPLQIVAVPYSPETTLPTPGKAAAVVFVTDPDQKPAAQPETLRVLYGLTCAETKLAMLLMEGKSLLEAAELSKIGRETVRSQLKSIFGKTGTRRQSELIGLLARLPEGDTGTE